MVLTDSGTFKNISAHKILNEIQTHDQIYICLLFTAQLVTFLKKLGCLRGSVGISGE